jgi:uncharacterized protein YndB with AHSA1/START domain
MNQQNRGTTLAADHEIIITRVFNAPRALVFSAWTDPKHVEQWWGPQGFKSSECQIDLREGGVFRLQMHGPDGVRCPCNGIYREVVEPERIVYIGAPDDGHPCGAGLPPRAIVTVTFTELDGKTTLTIHTRLESAADRDAAVKAGFHPGWSQSLERLAGHLGTMA